MSDAGHQLGIPVGQTMHGLLGHVGETWGDRHQMVARAINWMTCEPSQDAGPDIEQCLVWNRGWDGVCLCVGVCVGCG